MIRVRIEVDLYGHEFIIVREQEHFDGSERVSDTIRRMASEAEAAMHGALNSVPER